MVKRPIRVTTALQQQPKVVVGKHGGQKVGLLNFILHESTTRVDRVQVLTQLVVDYYSVGVRHVS